MPVDRRIAGRFVNARQEPWTESLYRLFRAGMGCGNGWVSLARTGAGRSDKAVGLNGLRGQDRPL